MYILTNTSQTTNKKVINMDTLPNTPIKIIRYKTSKSILAEYLNCSESEVEKLPLNVVNEDNELSGITGGLYLDTIRRNRMWGFAIPDSREIHIWAAKNANVRDLIWFIAHERGHMFKPRYRSDYMEEMKANTYGDAAQFAYDMLKELKEK